ncbi:MAG: hypothetical protein ACTSQE_02140 [Candidatus Heimdallarchaeaceae archaeon]
MTKRLPWIFPGIRRPRFSLHQISFRIPTEIPQSVWYFIVYGIIFYIFSGGAYDIVNKEFLVPLGSGSGGKPLFIYPGTQAQFLIEGLVAGFVIAFAALSLYLYEHATKFTFDVSTAQKIEFLATLLLFIWYVVIILLFKAKK